MKPKTIIWIYIAILIVAVPAAVLAGLYGTETVVGIVLATILAILLITTAVIVVNSRRQQGQPVPTSDEADAQQPAVRVDENGNEIHETATGAVIHTADGRTIVLRYNKSFLAKLIQAKDTVKDYYNTIKNYALGHEKVTTRISWHHESVHAGRKKIAQFVLRGKSLYLYLPLNPDDYAGTEYKVEHSKGKRYESYPCLYRIKNARRVRYATELIDTIMERYGLEYINQPNENFVASYPYEPTSALIERGLIKVSKVNNDEPVIAPFAVVEQPVDEVEEPIEEPIEEPVEEPVEEVVEEIVEEEMVEEPVEEPVEEQVEEIVEEEPIEEVVEDEVVEEEVIEEEPEEESEEEVVEDEIVEEEPIEEPVEEPVEEPIEEVVEEEVVEEEPIEEEVVEDEIVEEQPIEEEVVEEEPVRPEPMEEVQVYEVSALMTDEEADSLVVHSERKADTTKKGIINIDTLSAVFEDGETVTIEQIKKRVPSFNKKVTYLKVLARGTLNKRLIVEADEFSNDAKKMILLTGGQVLKTL